MMEESWVYILKCSDSSYYTGCTTNLVKRISEHSFSKFDNYTSSRLPVKLVYSQKFSNISDAINAERQIKGWEKKERSFN